MRRHEHEDVIMAGPTATQQAVGASTADGHPDDVATAERLLATARALRDELVARQAETEELTRYSPEVHAIFESAGFYDMLVPREYGGLEVTPRTFFSVARELARGDLSAAWGFTLAANHALMLANWFPESVHREIFSTGAFRSALMYAPTVTATSTEDGWRLDGVVNFCSGIPYSTHFIGAARLAGTTPDGSPRLGIYVAPKSQFTVLDDWGGMHGLNGTGSNSIRFDAGVIPEQWLIEDADITAFGVDGHSSGSLAYGNAMYSGRHMSTFTMSLAAVCVGGGFNALDAYAEVMRTRTTTLPPFIPRTEDPDFLRWYGEAFISLSKAQATLESLLDRWLAAAERNVAGEAAFDAETDLLLAGIARELMLDVWETVERTLHRTIGAGATRRGDRFERVFRDLAQAAAHRNPQLREPMFRVVAAQQLAAS
jgi:3-hydroxy-9,10-secoandrosta-1,3,5(10)-triene-9,17-dione monooxygenase